MVETPDQHPNELNEPLPIGELVQNTEAWIGEVGLERRQAAQIGSFKSEIDTVKGEMEELMDRIESGEDSPELREKYHDLQLELQAIQADHIDLDGTTGSNRDVQ